MCLAALLMTSEDGPLCQERTWRGPTCADGLQISDGTRVLLLRLRSSRWSTSEMDGHTFIPCFDCAAAVELVTSSTSDSRGFETTDTRDSRLRAREMLWRRTRRSTSPRT